MSGRVTRGAALALTLLALCAMTVATKPGLADDSLPMQALLKPDGSGFLIVNTPSRPMSWEACSADLAECAPFDGNEPNGWLNTGDAQPETVFRVTGDGSTGLSPLWHGNVSPLTAPSVVGEVRANELVRPVPGQWQGGWEGEGDVLQLAACRTQEATGCTTLTDSHYPSTCPGRSAVIDPAFIGDYLHVANRRQGAGPHYELLYLSTSPYHARGGVWRPSSITSAAVVGRIAPPTGKRTNRCGFPPLNRASISRSGIARLKCGLGCRVLLIAGRRGRRVHVTRKLAPPEWFTQSPIALRLPRRLLARLGSGRARMVVRIDGRRVARRTVLLSAQARRHRGRRP